ncbi:hypothetical protein M406DRAFT_36802 [Cryphonectria parasitica EP155]|uniref:Carboxylic ester hydrolase n=1 Tax=Cryphonectria parasitica (strain ATCC 38755 / EP155) TaxID=660469 RepID=A0A9P4Y2X4_CRYP1|nr:uncharacterized protein M406DRAFT_36802 [Cryphonectria parasitica EP155]KAF3765372.1 hypothetical protein M406DRAFT_36802 [Cryphonectria parasitica EP155]
MVPHILSLLSLGLTLSPLVAAESSPVVTTGGGSWRGTVSDYVDGVNVFKGIHFSGSSAGSLRWTHSPKPTISTVTVNATEFGPECPQLVDGVVTGDEDCLYLNVWTPEGFTNTSNLPIFFFAYGGRFEGGAASSVTYDGSALAKKGVVVVTMNYRLGPLGWLAHPQLTEEVEAAYGYNGSGNWGLMDQQAALHWTVENIQYFGGNATSITVAGQSAGSALALDIAFTSQETTGLFQRIIAESGARAPNDPLIGSLATSHLTQEEAYAIGEKFLASLNVSTIDEARNLSLATILQGAYGDGASDTTFDGTSFAGNQAYLNPPLWRPVIDGYYFPLNYSYALATGNHSDVPILTGNNRDESGASPNPGVDLATYTANNTAIFEPLGLADEFNSLFPATTDAEANNQTNALYRNQSLISTWQWANDWAAGGAQSNVYTYYWTHAPPGQSAGAFHGSELNYVFGNLAYSETLQGEAVSYTTEDYAIAETLQSYWINFIKTGDPNGGNLTYWAPSTSTSKTTFALGDAWGNIEVGSDEAIEFFQDFFSQEPEY